ncbi:hypothetical protein [Devosia sp. SL43]|uniref:hypothetical protein n=1 Tax=Devosia sp. SL43 TaxID=2806348 RepID=UPI001F2E3612|nr:hypothetical protein [Devosia sp. SL43]UJW85801.1 hypothetical protein IM737_00390 [Devosia sp. SL43]
MGRTDGRPWRSIAVLLAAGSFLAGCSRPIEPSLKKYVDILSQTDMAGVQLIPVTSTVCAIFNRDDFSAKAEGDGSFRYIDEGGFETWVVSQPYDILRQKLLSINISHATGRCSAYVKSVTL